MVNAKTSVQRNKMISPCAVYAIWSVWEFTPNPPNEFQFMGHLLMNHHNRFCKSVNLQIQKLNDETLIGGVREKPDCGKHLVILKFRLHQHIPTRERI